MDDRPRGMMKPLDELEATSESESSLTGTWTWTWEGDIKKKKV